MTTLIALQNGQKFMSSNPEYDYLRILIERTKVAGHQLSFEEAQADPEMINPQSYLAYFNCSFEEVAKQAWDKVRGVKSGRKIPKAILPTSSTDSADIPMAMGVYSVGLKRKNGLERPIKIPSKLENVPVHNMKKEVAPSMTREEMLARLVDIYRQNDYNLDRVSQKTISRDGILSYDEVVEVFGGMKEVRRATLEAYKEMQRRGKNTSKIKELIDLADGKGNVDDDTNKRSEVKRHAEEQTYVEEKQTAKAENTTEVEQNLEQNATEVKQNLELKEDVMSKQSSEALSEEKTMKEEVVKKPRKSERKSRPVEFYLDALIWLTEQTGKKPTDANMRAAKREGRFPCSSSAIYRAFHGGNLAERIEERRKQLAGGAPQSPEFLEWLKNYRKEDSSTTQEKAPKKSLRPVGRPPKGAAEKSTKKVTEKSLEKATKKSTEKTGRPAKNQSVVVKAQKALSGIDLKIAIPGLDGEISLSLGFKF